MKAVDMTMEVLNSCRYNYDKEKWLAANPEDDEKVVVYGPAPTELLKEGRVFDNVLKRRFADISTEDVKDFVTGSYPAGYSRFEKPGTADQVAHWDKTQCI